MKNLKNEVLYPKNNRLTDEIFTRNTLFFDIETTGFSPNSASVYLIGCSYRQNDTVIVEQFFAQDKSEEPQLLLAFAQLLAKFETIVTFNGTGFDIPFLKAKYEAFQIEDPFPNHVSLDIFKQIGTIKFLLKLENYKQKTIEQFLGIPREDSFSGGELIPIYEDYLLTRQKDAERFLLLHNYEDVLGMLDLLPILSYAKILNGAYTVVGMELTPYTTYEGTSENEFLLTLQNAYPVPKRVSYQQDGFYFTMHKEYTKIRIPVFEGELKFFYPNYKDYYYLPQEDTAIHKSVASFVDKPYRERAKAANCYTRREGIFLPQKEIVMQPFFLKTHKDNISYFELTEDFLTSGLMIQRYVEHIFRSAQKSK